jgi:hypothetical protein
MTYNVRITSSGGVNVQVLYLAKGNGPEPQDVAKWLDDLGQRAGLKKLIDQLFSVVCIEATHASAPEPIRKGLEGYYHPTARVLWMAAHAASPALLTHEVGHHVATMLGTAASAELLAEVFKATYTSGGPSPADMFKAFAGKAGY